MTAPIGDLEKDARVSSDRDSANTLEPGAEVLPAHGVQDAKNTSSTLETTPSHQAQAAAAAAPLEPRQLEAASEGQMPTGKTRLQNVTAVAALCTALFLAALDLTIVTTAIPSIASDFGSTVGFLWVGSAYMLANAAFAPSWGKVSDIWGRKPVLLAAVALFWIGSLLGGLATSMSMLIAARAVQGAGGGGIVILVNICVSDLFSIRERGFYFGVVGMVWSFAGALGPLLGGVFVQTAHWRWCFLINLPISGVGAVILWLVLRLHNPRTPIRDGLAAVDWWGTASIIGATVMVMLGLEFGGVVLEWNSPAVVCLLVSGVVAGALFLVNEWMLARYPIIPMHLFRHRTSVSALAVCFFQSAVFMAGAYFLPLYLQAVLSFSPFQSGLAVLPYVMALSLVSVVAGIFINKTGRYRRVVIGGMAVMTAGFALLTNLGRTTDWSKLVLYQLVAGAGVGCNFQAPLIALQTRLEPRDIASGTATFGFLRQLATSIAVVVGGVVFQNRVNAHQPVLRDLVGPETANQLSGSNAMANVPLLTSLGGQGGDAARAAYLDGIRWIYIVFSVLAALGLLASLAIGSRVLDVEHKEHKTGLAGMRAARGTEPRRGSGVPEVGRG